MNTKRKKTGRKLLGFMLTLALVLGLMPGLSLTAYATQNKVNYLEGSWDQEKGECAFTENSTDSYTVVDANSTVWGAGTYVVNSEVTISGRITVNGTANLILCDGAKLTASSGITVEGTNALNIYPGSTAESIEGTGQLIASNANGWYAVIGGTPQKTGGTVTIYGGKVTATSGGDAAGIGGGAEGAGGAVTVYGGEVTATSRSNGAGIGGGEEGAGGTVTVYGGEVTATSESWGAGIGGGWCKSGGTVSIYGGTVTAS
ncbi:MAG: hypothetical protein IJT72_02570, partial [Lachnospiraceae bacterium]|nr:hypothetical protein [Lachnospiraceae bacterium]